MTCRLDSLTRRPKKWSRRLRPAFQGNQRLGIPEAAIFLYKKKSRDGWERKKHNLRNGTNKTGMNTNEGK
jgi:hypothetical protein